jgi:hypothetical protein
MAETYMTPDPFNPASAPDYGESTGPGVDQPIEFFPPWAITRAPGTVATIAPGPIIPINPWIPVIALLNGDQLAALNREQANRQAISYWNDDPHTA